MADDLLQALEASDATQATELFMEKIAKGGDAWEIHLSLFPLVQRVLNPPFINPHLPKMHRIYRELIPYLKKDDIPALIRLEVNEYARRPKLEKLPKASLLPSTVSFSDVESAIRERDREKTAVLIATFYAQAGGAELARRLLLLGSGYLQDSLGHSVSCTAFILLEMLERTDQDPWPALATLADYFCKGGFYATPALRKTPAFPSNEIFDQHLLRATSGRGIVNLHHTITIYAMERVRHCFTKEEYNHMIGAWIGFMGEKKLDLVMLDSHKTDLQGDYNRFYETFSTLEAKSIVASIQEMIASHQGRLELGRFLIKGLCDRYQGDYNPHYLTGLGSALWVADRCWKQASVVINAFYQYVDFLFDGLKSED
ncbi:MAG: hypothetical protein MUO29_08145 [Desulfobacterales bacterium]|nr:hypothetical protein [Desulfobacterales bacterium]